MSRKTQRYSKEFKAEAVSTPHKMEDWKVWTVTLYPQTG